MNCFSITITGKPNVGKSTLFNKLTFKKHAIVHNTEGVTRDYNESQIKINENNIIIRDTAGIIISPKSQLDHLINKQTKSAINAANIIFMMVDGSCDIDAQDIEIASIIRKSNKPVYLLVNKLDCKRFDMTKFLKFGFSNTVEISAEHNKGIERIREIIIENMENHNRICKTNMDEIKMQEEEEGEDRKKEEDISISLVGRVNVGKSTMFNQMVKEERSIAHDTRCVTRDQISKTIIFDKKPITIIDTPGFQKYNEDNLSKIIEDTNKILLQKTDIAILVIDATEDGLLKLDFKVANLLVSSGAIVILAVNKSDILKNKKELQTKIKNTAKSSLSQIYDINIDMVSSIKGIGIRSILKKAIKLYKLSERSFTTSKLNKWVSLIQKKMPPKNPKGGKAKIKYMVQSGNLPYYFKIFVSHKLHDSYIRFLTKSFIRDHNLAGLFININQVISDNPYN